MLFKIDVGFVLLHVSTLTIIIMSYLIFKVKSRSQLKNVFLGNVVLLLIWNLSTLAEVYTRMLTGHTEMVLINICYISICFLPVCILFCGIIYAQTQIKLSRKHVLLAVIPAISVILIWTNNLHKLFFIHYSIYNKDAVYGIYFYLHSIYSYVCIFTGIVYLIVFSIKNSGFFSKQSFLLILGMLIPVIVNVIFTFNLAEMSFMVNSIAFTFSSFCIMIAIFKFDFLDIVPIATKTVLNRISDGFLVIDKNMRIIDYNKTALDLFGRVSILKRKDSLFKVLSTFESVNPNILEKSLKKIETTWKPVIFEHHFKEKSFNKYFNIEITPIISKENILGNIILLRDISGYKEQLKIIKKQQEQIIERECLASLGTLMGGISHNLKTPIMSISGCIIALEDLISEYDESIDNPIVSSDDHHEIAAEMKKRMGDLNGHLTYISNALTAMKNQVANPANRKDMKFTVEEVVLNVDFLMKYEIKSNLCTLITRVEASPDKKVKGDIGTFVQIINNLITNSIQSYEKINDDNRINALSRKIELSIYETGGSIVFKVQDFGKGISGAIKEKLFKEMVTTKGKEGTGIGLFLSSAKVKGSFNGDMWFESQENKGTTFYIKVPSLDISKE